LIDSAAKKGAETMALNLKHITAIVLIGDGLLALMSPERDALAWRMGPEPFRSLMSYMAKRPALTRWVGATQIAVGIWWVLSEEPATSPRRA
jgi:hypothetical protein